MRRATARDHRAGALARNAALTPERRSEIARMGALARWAKASASVDGVDGEVGLG